MRGEAADWRVAEGPFQLALPGLGEVRFNPVEEPRPVRADRLADIYTANTTLVV